MFDYVIVLEYLANILMDNRFNIFNRVIVMDLTLKVYVFLTCY